MASLSLNMSQERNTTVDLFKGLAIIFVVLTHTVFNYTNPSLNPGMVPDHSNFSTVLKNLVNSGLILFIVISGYYYRPDRSVRENIGKRVKQLLIPMLILMLVLPSIMFIILTVTGKNPDLTQFGNFLVATYLGQYFCEQNLNFDRLTENQFYADVHIYYFLQVLIIALIVFYIIAKYCLKDWKISVGVTAVMLAITGVLFEYNIRLPFYLELVPIAICALLAGAWVKKFDLLDKIDGSWKTGKYWGIMLLLLLAAAALFYVFPVGMYYRFSLGSNGWISAFTFFIGEIVGSAFLIMACGVFVRIPLLNKFLIFIGSYVLYIFAFHMFYVKLISSFFCEVSTKVSPEIDYGSVGAAAAVAIAAMILSIATGYAIMRVKNRISEKRNVANQ